MHDQQIIARRALVETKRQRRDLYAGNFGQYSTTLGLQRRYRQIFHAAHFASLTGWRPAGSHLPHRMARAASSATLLSPSAWRRPARLSKLAAWTAPGSPLRTMTV